MKHLFQFISICLAITQMLLCSACANGKNSLEPFSEELSLKPLTAEEDSLLSYNPDRGFRSGVAFYLGDIVKLGSSSAINNKIYELLNNYVFSLYDNTEVVNVNYNLAAYNKDEVLPTEVTEAFKYVCETLRTKGYKQSINFVYNSTYHIAWTTSEEAKKNVESVCASEDIILSHINQLSEYVSEYKDTVYSIMGGFIGFSGDMAESSQYPPVNRLTVMKAIIEKLVVPNDVYFLIRDPLHKYELEKESPDYPYLSKISFVNKAMFGEQTKSGWNSGGYQKGNPENKEVDAWEYVTKQALYAPNDGELFPNSNLIGKQSYPVARLVTGIDVIKECAHHGMTTMGFWNGYYEVNRATESPAIMDLWQTEQITEEILKENNIIYDPDWFKDSSGNTVGRNAFEFIRDHLGYKLSATKGSVSSNGDEISSSLSLKNYGFSAAFNLTGGFAILDSKFEAVTEVDIGEPSKWYSHNPEDPYSTDVLEHIIEAKLPIPQKTGKYYIAFYLQNTMGEGAVLSNSDIAFENGYNILYEFEVK